MCNIFAYRFFKLSLLLRVHLTVAHHALVMSLSVLQDLVVKVSCALVLAYFSAASRITIGTKRRAAYTLTRASCRVLLGPP